MAVFMRRRAGKAKVYDLNTLFLIHGDEIADSSNYRVPITNNGVQVSAAQGKFGGSSLYFDGSSRLLIPQSAIPFNSGDFTIDWWEYAENGATCRFVTAYSPYAQYGGIQAGWSGTHLTISDNIDSAWDLDAYNAMNVSVGQWVHWAIVRSGNSIKTYRNGTLFYSGSISVPIASPAEYMMAIGSDRQNQPAGSNWKGYMAEFRISNVARWTTNFTPPTEPY